jgi:hypothetical protein
MPTDVSEEYIASIFRVEEYAAQETSVKASGKKWSSEDGGDMFLRNVCWHSADYTALYSRR